MKINFPSTKQIIGTLLLLNTITTSPIKAGSEFNKCLGKDFYETVSNFAVSVPDKEVFCCNSCSLKCAPGLGDDSCPLGRGICNAAFATLIQGQCSKIDKSKFCVTKGY